MLGRCRRWWNGTRKAEGAGDVEGAVAVYTDDVIHDAVGFPGSPRQGLEAARDFYRYLTANFRTDDEQPLHEFATDDALVLEQLMSGTVIGEMLGIPGSGRRVSFRILHVFEFRDGSSVASRSGSTQRPSSSS